MRSWLTTGLHAIWSPRAAGRAVRLDLVSVRRLCLMNCTVAWLALLIPGVLTLVMGERMLSLTPSSGATFVIPDTGMYGAVFASIGLPIYLGACLLTSAQRLLQRRNCRESYWPAMALATYPLAFGAIFVLGVSLFIRTLPVGVVHDVSGLDLAPLLVLIVAIANRMVPIIIAIVLAAIIHVAVFRCTRYANPARPFPPAPSHA